MAIGTGAAILGSAVLGGLASRSAAKTQAGAAQSAADAQLQASREANALQQKIYEENIARQQPFLQTGTEFFNRLAAVQRGGPEAQQFLQMDPGYQFRLSEGMKALDRQAAARGGLISGGALKAAQRYGQDLGSQEYSAAYGRLAGLADVGPRAAGIMSGLGERYGQTAGQNMMAGGQAAAQGLMGAGAARASGYIGGANALTGALGRYLNYNQNQQLLNRLLPSGGGGGSPIVSTPYDYGVDQQFSDVRLKTNIVKVGTRDDGLNVYEFNYVWGGPRRVGLMAQEVQNVYPDAVAEVDGYLTVDYGKV